MNLSSPFNQSADDGLGGGGGCCVVAIVVANAVWMYIVYLKNNILLKLGTFKRALTACYQKQQENFHCCFLFFRIDSKRIEFYFSPQSSTNCINCHNNFNDIYFNFTQFFDAISSIIFPRVFLKVIKISTFHLHSCCRHCEYGLKF